MEAMTTNGVLSVTTEILPAGAAGASAEVPMIRVTVSDTGVGIKQENMVRLFEPFFTTKENGTGLGLAIARRLIREHRGDISIESEVGKGTTISVILPIQVNSPVGLQT
jgi:two-component system sensor histidine kinase FlrB